MSALPAVASGLSRWERLFLASLAGFMLASRIPFVGRLLYHWDSVQFVLGMAHFDVAQHQPHPPGYVLYVLLGRLVQTVAPDPNRALVLLGILAGAAAAPLVYLLGRSLYGPAAGAAAALFFATSPLVWFFGEVALSDIVEGMGVALAGLLCWRARQGSARDVVFSAAALGIAGGIRQQTLVLLLPLWLYSAWPHGGKRVAAGALVGGACVASWLVPMVALSGGWEAYHRACAEVWQGTHGAAMVRRLGPGSLLNNTAMVAISCLLGLSLAVVPLVACLPAAIRGQGDARRTRHPASAFLAVWILPGLAFYILARVVRPGILMTLLPALFVWAGAVAARQGNGASEGHGGHHARLAMVVGLVAVLNALLFVGSRTPLSAWRLRQGEQDLGGRLAVVRSACPPETTAILTHRQHFYLGFRLAAYYLPEYRVVETGWLNRPPWVLGHRGSVTFADHPGLPPRIERIVLFDYDRPADLPPALRRRLPHPVRDDISLPGGGRLFCYRSSPRRALQEHR